VETPIKVIIAQGGYSSYHTALLTSNFDAIGYSINRYEAVCGCLTKAGLLEIIDIEELRKRSEKLAVPERLAAPEL